MGFKHLAVSQREKGDKRKSYCVALGEGSKRRRSGSTRSVTVGRPPNSGVISTPFVVQSISLRSQETPCLWFIEKDKD